MIYPALELYVGGRWLRGEGREERAVYDPATGELLGQLPLASSQDVDAAIAAAHQAFPLWRQVPALERARLLQAISARLREQSAMLAHLLSREQGKTIREALGEVAGAADTFEWMGEEAKRIYGRTVPSRLPGAEQLVLYEPAGPVAAFAPWNFPAVLAVRKVAAALAAGCTVVLKPAEETPGIMVAIARLCEACGLPPGVLNILYGHPDEISRKLITAPEIQKISFTGSVPVGRHLSSLAGAEMKRITLELGGHSPVIVDQGVDVDRVATAAVAAKFRNAGQLCHAPTRFIVHEASADAFAQALASHAKTLRLGIGLNDATQMGPLTHSRRLDAMQAFCDDAVANGARVLCGGRRCPELPNGHFFEPTVISEAGSSLLAMREEPFGPLALISRYGSVDQAIALANAVDLGLGAFAFTSSYEFARRLQSEIEAGSISFNTFAISPPEMPFSGWKQSGLGAEMGIEGLREYLKTKAVIRAPF